MSETILKVQHLGKSFGNNEILKDIDFSVKPKDVTCIIGPSGSGKSTLLRCMNLLETPSSGEIRYHGTNIMDKHVNVPEYRSKVGMVFQNFNLFNNMTVLKNCTVGQEKVLKKSKEEAHKNAMMYLEKVGMAPYINAKPKQLSGGQKQRVAIGKALIRTPKIFLMDEPLSNLDAKLRTQMRMEIKELYEHSDATFVYVTHDQTEAMTLGTKIVVLNNGKIQQASTPKELYNKPANLFVAQFIGTPQMNIWKAEVIQEKRNVMLFIGGLGRYRLSEKNAELLRKRGYFDKEVYVGIRPEDIFLQVKGMDDEMFQSSLAARLKVYEPDGAVSYLHLETAGESDSIENKKISSKENVAKNWNDTMKSENKFNSNVTIRIEGNGDFREGEEYHFGFDESKIHFFDIETEKAIR